MEAFSIAFPSWSPDRSGQALGMRTNLLLKFKYYATPPGFWKKRNSVLQLCHPSGVQEKKETQCYNYFTPPGFGKKRNSMLQL